MCGDGSLHTGWSGAIISDLCAWNDLHERIMFVDATPVQLGIAIPGHAPISLSLHWPMPIYLAEYFAALVAVLIAEPGQPTAWWDGEIETHCVFQFNCCQPGNKTEIVKMRFIS